MGLLLAFLLTLQRDPGDEAVRKGIAHLKSKAADAGDRREQILCVLLEVGVPTSDLVVDALLKDLESKPPETTRSAALQARSLSLLRREVHRERLGHCAQFLVDNQAADGQWGAGQPVDPPELQREPPPPPTARTPTHVFGQSSRGITRIPVRRKEALAATGDPDNSFWALIGLSACRTAEMIAPPETLEKAEKAWRVGEVDPVHRLFALSTCLSLLHRDWKEDPDVLRAAAQLKPRPFPTDPASLHLLKRAMYSLGCEKLVDRDWQADGAKTLLAAQAVDGGWGSLEDTCAALRFLYIPRFRGIPEDSQWRGGWK